MLTGSTIKVAEAIREYKEHFQPFLDVLVKDEFDSYKKAEPE